MALVTFQVMSDLHLETHPSYEFDFNVAASNLALLGDIGHVCDGGLFSFLETQLTRYSTVFFLLGNHEPYHMSFERAKIQLREFAAKADRRHTKGLAGRFVFLDQRRFDVSAEITVLGCTLYSKVDWRQEFAVETRLVDFRDILRWTVDDHNAAHQADLAWLNEQVSRITSEEPNRRIVIFTHHSPSVDERSFSPKHKESEVSSGFSTDLRQQTCWTSPAVVAWCFGHTHFNCDFVDSTGKRLLANQRGYKLLPQNTFYPIKLLRIEQTKVVAGSASVAEHD